MLDYGDVFVFDISIDDIVICMEIFFDGVLDDDNLIVKVVWLLVIKIKCDKGVVILLDKCFFMGGGIGGGLLNVVIMLVVFNYFWNIGLSEDELVEFGLFLGVDVFIFVWGLIVFVGGVGEEIMLVF